MWHSSCFRKLGFRSEHGRNAALNIEPMHLGIYITNLGLIFLSCIAFCIVAFGLLPMALLHGFTWLVSRCTGRV
nr:putative integron gene cassette protein [uncultured bacterium]